MIEYIYDAIKATAGEDVVVNAKITEPNGEEVKENCFLSLLDDDKEIIKIRGSYTVDKWSFVIPGKETKGLNGRFWYSIGNETNALSFKQPFYLV